MEYQERVKNIGEKIKAIRLEKGLTQIDLSTLCSIEQTNIARIEAGRTSPTIKTLYKISDALNIDIKELF
ncbi:MAG: helix-turn-helix domain-containing protein [Fluviicola sp.]